MQLKLKRSQRSGGLTGGKIFFCLDVRAEYTPEELANIQKYKLGGEVLYSSEAAKRHSEAAVAHLDEGSRGSVGGLLKGVVSVAMAKFNLNVTIDSLAKGQHIECKDLQELLGAESAIHEACKNVKQYLDVAKTFDGREVVVDFSATAA
jgi:hypothetical protein